MLAGHELKAVVSRVGFRRLLAVRLSSQFADGLFQAGLAGNVLFNPSKHTSPIAIATSFAVLLLPYSLIGPYIGVFLDRWSRRNILFVANLTRALVIIPTALLVWHGSDGPGFAVLVLLVIAINRFFLAGLSAALPHVTDDVRLVTGNAVVGTLGTVAYSLGLASSVGLLALVGQTSHGYAGIVATALFGYALSAILARAFFSPTDLGPDDTVRPTEPLLAGLVAAGRGMIAGARHLGERSGALYPLLAQGISRGLFGLLTIATLLFAGSLSREHGPRFLGGVVLAGALGALVAALITPAAKRRWGSRVWLCVLFVAVAVMLPPLLLPFRWKLMLLAVFLINIASMGTKIVVDTALQHECDDEYRGRVFSVNDTAFNTLYVLGLFIGAYTLPEDGRSIPVMVVVSVGYALVGLWYTLVTRE